MEPIPLSTLQTPFIFLIIALCMRALFSFLETSITALRLFKLKEMAEAYPQYKALFNTLEKNPHRVLITIVISNSLADVTTAAIATYITEVLFSHLNFSNGVGFSLGIGVATICIIIFGEIIPKNIAKRSGERLFKSTIWIINFIYLLLYPIVTILLKISDFFITKITGKDETEGGCEWVSSEKEIQFLIGYIKDKGIMETEKTTMLQNIFDLGHTPVREVFVPSVKIVSVNASSMSKDVVDLFLKHGFTRFPVYENKVDNIIGMVHLKDVFALAAKNINSPVKDIMRPILFIPESVKINQLLKEFKQQHKHIAIVINEHGSMTGLVTLEDVLEEIVGEIIDENEMPTEKITSLQKGGWIVDGTTPLEDLEQMLGIIFDTEDAVTLGGFITEQLQRLPQKGEQFQYKQFNFYVQQATQKQVLRVLISSTEEPIEQKKEE
ncbi:MAG TPA: hemolysin family protein [Candidatus Babeliales bacterium]|nr:hemolysin family protein [Candidatus Babeliales bacterium]